MKIKDLKNNKELNKGFRCSKREFYDIQKKANLYTEGNLSQWVVYAAKNYKPKREELDYSE